MHGETVKDFLYLWCFLQGRAYYVIRLILTRYFTVRKNVTLYPIFLGKPYILIRHHLTILYLYLNKGLWIDYWVFKDALSDAGNILNWINANVTELRKTRCWPISMTFLSGPFGNIKKLRKGLNTYSWCPCRDLKHSHPQTFVRFAFRGTIR
jgi:hypothetical protein